MAIQLRRAADDLRACGGSLLGHPEAIGGSLGRETTVMHLNSAAKLLDPNGPMIEEMPYSLAKIETGLSTLETLHDASIDLGIPVEAVIQEIKGYIKMLSGGKGWGGASTKLSRAELDGYGRSLRKCVAALKGYGPGLGVGVDKDSLMQDLTTAVNVLLPGTGAIEGAKMTFNDLDVQVADSVLFVCEHSGVDLGINIAAASAQLKRVRKHFGNIKGSISGGGRKSYHFDFPLRPH